MGRRMPAVRVVAPAVVAAVLTAGLSACGGGGDGVVSADVPTAAAIVDPSAVSAGAASAPNTALPDVQVVRVASNETVALQTLAPTGKPMLLWFWAPHCTFCRGEAPDLVAFEKTYGDRITVLGLGAQDDLDQAVDFLSDTSTGDLEMVWEEAGKTWRHFQVTNQPTVVVVDAAGTVRRTWFRDFDAEQILAAAGVK